MEFFTVSRLKRPVRLCESTRQFAYDSLHHRYGREAMNTPGVPLDAVPGIHGMTEMDRYDAAIREIALNAPLRLCEGERLSGAATLGFAIDHAVPATLEGKVLFDSTSHHTPDFETVLKRGIGGIREDVKHALTVHTGARKQRFLQSCLSVLDSLELWHGRYVQALAEKPEYADNYRALLNVPFKPAETFYEAVQSIWFTFAFMRLCGNWPGFGRLDRLLGEYLKTDLQNGTLTIDEAREILAHFFIKGCEWIRGGDYMKSGDAQHYQNIVLSGIDADGCDVTNEVTYLILDVIEELGISDFPTTIRVNHRTDEALLRRAAEVMRFGGGILAFYDEDSILASLTRFGYAESEARLFANDGCWEIQIPGKTYFIYVPFDGLLLLQQNVLQSYAPEVEYPDFEALYGAYVEALRGQVGGICRAMSERFTEESFETGEWVWKPADPCTVVSLFEQGCIEKGCSYCEGGPLYNVCSPHIGGFPDAVNSLYAIKKLVFDDHQLTFRELMTVLRNNWEGREDLRLSVLNGPAFYGNDNDECDAIATRLIADFAAVCAEFDGKNGYLFPAGISTFGRQLEWSQHRLATAHGHKAGEVLAPNCSPTPGSDRVGATAIIRSYCKADLTKMVTGAALDVKLLPTSVEGEDGLEAIVALIRGFISLGGSFIQPDVEDKELLKEAQRHPEQYPTLSVRVSGWNARFVTLCKEWQDMIIDENK